MELLSILLKADEPFRIFGIKLFDPDFYELILRLGLNLLVTYMIVWKIYQPTRKDSEYVFTYMVFSPIIFFICHLFMNADIDIGFAFGLFAIFSILRYRTTTIQVKEISYMFIVIAIAVLNALATKKVSYAELLFTNFFILGLVYMLERYWSSNANNVQTIYYEQIDHIKPSNEALLLANLEERTGKKIARYEIVESDFMRDMAKIRVYFKAQDDSL